MFKQKTVASVQIFWGLELLGVKFIESNQDCWLLSFGQSSLSSLSSSILDVESLKRVTGRAVNKPLRIFTVPEELGASPMSYVHNYESMNMNTLYWMVI